MFVRMAKTRKTFMLTIGQNGRDTDETLAHHPSCRCRAGAAPGRTASGMPERRAPLKSAVGRPIR